MLNSPYGNAYDIIVSIKIFMIIVFYSGLLYKLIKKQISKETAWWAILIFELSRPYIGSVVWPLFMK